MEGTQEPVAEGPRARTAQLIMKEWRAGAFSKHKLLRDIRNSGEGFAMSFLGETPQPVIEDDIVQRLIEDIRHLSTELDWKRVKLVDRIQHIHDQEEYGT